MICFSPCITLELEATISVGTDPGTEPPPISSIPTQVNTTMSSSSSTACSSSVPTTGSTTSSDHPPISRTIADKSTSRRSSTDQKTPRIRTVLTEQQLQTLRTVYQTNPRPDALLKEQLCELTGLSPRVIRVWFQNRRCKDKKKALQQAEVARMQQTSGGKVRKLPLYVMHIDMLSAA